MIISRVHETDTTSPSPSRPSSRTAVSHFPTLVATAVANNAPVCVIRVPAERASYSPFRSTFFHDPVVNPRLRGDGGEPDYYGTMDRESKRLWTANGPLINSRTPKTMTCPGSAFKNHALSADRLYSTNRNSLGYDVHRSLRGTSLCSTTKRFDTKPRTSASVGPGSYNLTVTPCREIHQPAHTEPPRSTVAVLPSDRLKQWGGRPDTRPMDSSDEWKTTSEKPTPAVYTFQRARQASWIVQIEERQYRSDPLAKRLSSNIKTGKRLGPEQRLPDFVQGNPVYTKTTALSMLNQSPQPHDAPTNPTKSISLSSPDSFSPRSFDSLDQQALESAQAFVSDIS